MLIISDTYTHSYIHTYIIGHYKPSVKTIDLVYHTTYVVCVHFKHKWRDRLPIFRETFSLGVKLLSDFLPEICWEEIAEEIFFFHISLWCLKSYKAIHYLLLRIFKYFNIMEPLYSYSKYSSYSYLTTRMNYKIQ